MDKAFVALGGPWCFLSWGCGEREEDSVTFISRVVVVGVVELSVLFFVDDKMVQLCVVPAEYGRRFVPCKDGMFRRVGREWICIKDGKDG